jgi:hypothetical protein
LFVHEGNTLYLLPVPGSVTNWYKNLLPNSTLKISISNSARGQPIADSGKVNYVVRKFKSKYGNRDAKKYYPKKDAAVEVLQ